MTEPDDDDRLLDAFLDRRSPLASAWRDEATAGQGAPASLDAAILAAAAAELSDAAKPVTPPRRPTRLRRWRLPVSLAASLLVSIGVLREGLRDAAAPPPRAAVLAPLPAPAQQAPQDVPMAAALAPPEETAKRAPLPAPAAPLPPDSRPEIAALPSPIPSPPPPLAESQARSPAESPAESAAVSLPESSAEPAAERAAAAPERAPALAAMPRLAEARRAEADALAAKADPPATADQTWQPARYRGQVLGQFTADALRQPAASADAEPDADAGTAPQADPAAGSDPRGTVTVQLAAGRGVVTALHLALAPPLPLAVVQQMEGLSGDGRAVTQDDARCAAELPLADGLLLRRWPQQGVQLRLTAAGTVMAIDYLEHCP
ncbi:hypothetical protein [Nevskia sp.]|uniref:hypothetical protein n=1 Tax=Nevskia sp. TaxID=1929292 RepID=UPI003F6F0137